MSNLIHFIWGESSSPEEKKNTLCWEINLPFSKAIIFCEKLEGIIVTPLRNKKPSILSIIYPLLSQDLPIFNANQGYKTLCFSCLGDSWNEKLYVFFFLLEGMYLCSFRNHLLTQEKTYFLCIFKVLGNFLGWKSNISALKDGRKKRQYLQCHPLIPWKADSSHGPILYLKFPNYCQGNCKLLVFFRESIYFLLKLGKYISKIFLVPSTTLG